MGLVKYHCDALLPTEERYLSPKYRLLSRWFNPYKLHPAHADELRIFMQTPGLLHVHVRHMMQWDHNGLANARLLLTVKQPDPTLLLNNAASITLDDGRAMLVALLDGKPDFAHAPPLQVTRYLQHRRRYRATATELADEFKTTPARIRRWWRADIFDPLSGKPRPAHTLHRNRPIMRSKRRIGLVI